MKTGLKVSLAWLLLTGLVACSGGNNNNGVVPVPQPSVNLNGICNPQVNPQYLSNPQCNTTNLLNRPNINSLNGLPNQQTADIGILQAGGSPVIRNRTFSLGRGYGIEKTDDNCTVNKDAELVPRPVRRALKPGADNMVFNFDPLGNLMIGLRTGVGEVRTPGPLLPGTGYTLDGTNINFPQGFTLVGQPSGAYVAMETNFSFGMLRATDKKIREDNDIPAATVSDPWSPLPSWSVPSFAGTSSFNPNFNLTGAQGINNQNVNSQQALNSVQALGGIGLAGNVNELQMSFQATSAQIVTYPINPQHVLEIYFPGLSYESSSVVATQTPVGSNDCRAQAQGELLFTELR